MPEGENTLAELRVLDLSRGAAGAYASNLFADCGVDVIGPCFLFRDRPRYSPSANTGARPEEVLNLQARRRFAMPRVEINGAQLDVRERGSGEPVVFVHGAMGDECAAVVKEPALTDHYRVIDYHRRGWGNSTYPEGVDDGVQQATADCRAVMRYLGVERAHMAGQSGGGQVLLQLALDAPETVQSLALLEPALPSVLFSSPQFGATVEKMGALYESGDKAGAVEAFAREVGGPDFDAARAVMDRTLPAGYFERWVAAADTLFRMLGAPEWSFTKEDAARIKQPVLNVRGASTQPYFREIFETVGTWLPQAQNFVLPDANHCMLQMNPRGAAERLADFFSRHPMAGS